MNVFIGGAWPYANGSLHIGHIASLLPGDILARYYRQKGANVLYVSGSDCNGTPIAIRAKQEEVSPREIADRYHCEFALCFERLGFTYDYYTRTDNQHHHETVQGIFLELLNKGLIYKKTVKQTYCGTCEQFLPDRYVEGICPNCGGQARGDQCEHCSTILDPADLLQKTCKLCGNPPTLKDTEHFYFALSKFQPLLEAYVGDAKQRGTWRENAVHLTERYLKEGLEDRAVSRDLPIGVDIPVEGYEDKKIYVWIEAVSGYYSASKQWAKETGNDESLFWEEGTKTYYVHGKDNIPFHTIIWPAILLGLGQKGLPKHVVSSEYLTLEKKKISTSKGWAVWVPDLLERYDPDSIRYFLTVNAPENRDTDFSWREFIYSHNGELLGAYGNFINRTLKFVEKYYGGTIPEGEIDLEIREKLDSLYDKVGNLVEAAHFKQALEEAFSFIRFVNKYFDKQEPWKRIKENRELCDGVIYNCVHIIANLAQILSPFLPFSSAKVKEILSIEKWGWEQTTVPPGQKINGVTPLFERIDVKKIDEELGRIRRTEG